MSNYRTDKKALEESLKDEELVDLLGGLGKKVDYVSGYIGLCDMFWVCAGGRSQQAVREEAHARGVHAPRILHPSSIPEKYHPNLKLGYNLVTGKPILKEKV